MYSRFRVVNWLDERRDRKTEMRNWFLKSRGKARFLSKSIGQEGLLNLNKKSRLRSRAVHCISVKIMSPKKTKKLTSIHVFAFLAVVVYIKSIHNSYCKMYHKVGWCPIEGHVSCVAHGVARDARAAHRTARVARAVHQVARATRTPTNNHKRNQTFECVPSR